MSFVSRIERWLEDARRRKAAAFEGGDLERIEAQNVKMYEDLLADLRERKKPKKEANG